MVAVAPYAAAAAIARGLVPFLCLSVTRLGFGWCDTRETPATPATPRRKGPKVRKRTRVRRRRRRRQGREGYHQEEDIPYPLPPLLLVIGPSKTGRVRLGSKGGRRRRRRGRAVTESVLGNPRRPSPSPAISCENRHSA